MKEITPCCLLVGESAGERTFVGVLIRDYIKAC